MKRGSVALVNRYSIESLTENGKQRLQLKSINRAGNGRTTVKKLIKNLTTKHNQFM